MTGWREHDARLVGAAALAWAATAAGERGWSPALWALGGGGLLLAVLAGLVRPFLPTRRPVLGLLALSLLAGALAAVAAGARLHERETSALAVAARADAFVRVEGSVASRARPVGDGRLVAVDVEVTAVTVRGRRTAADVAAVVLGPPATWAAVVPGSSFAVRGPAHPPSAPSSVVALIIDTGDARIDGHAPRWSVLAQRVRSGLAEAASVNDPDTAGLLVALVDGDTSGISDLTTEQFRLSGLAHLLAVSGANVAIVTGAALWLLRLLRAPFALQVGGSATALVAFVLVAGPEPSVLRAAGMGVVMLVALASGRPRAAVPALCAAVLALLLLVSQLAVSVGFLLSVLATAGVVVLGAHWTGVLQTRMPTWLAASLAVAAAAAVTTLPVVVLLLPVVNLGSVLANVLAAPAVPIATVCGVLAALCAPLVLPVAELLCWCAGFCVRWIALVARVAADTDALQLALPPGAPAAGLVLGTAALLTALLAVSRRHPRVRAGVVGAVLGALVLSVPARCAILPWPPPQWVFAACDVGQGDATVVRVSADAAVLLDAGPDAGALERCLDDLGVTRLPLVVLTHFHDDHVAGLPAVLGERPTSRLVFGSFDGGPAEHAVRALAGAHDAAVQEVTAGWSTRIGGVHLEIVAPLAPIVGTTSDPNNNSLVVRVSVPGATMLVTGDLQHEAMSALVDCGCTRADVLKVPHHGSKNRDDEFLAQTGARIALVSAGADNDYGHPAPSTLAELRRLGMTVRRTDTDGTVLVVVRADGALALV